MTHEAHESLCKFTILIDMDDVLEDLVGAWTAALGKMYGTTVAHEDVTDWHIAKFYPTLSHDQLFNPLRDPAFWAALSPMDNAQKIVKRLMDDGHTIRVVTASHYKTVVPKITWLLSAFPFLTWKDVIIASDKQLISGDIRIDDGVHNLEETSCLKLLFDRPHNRVYDAEGNGMVRVTHWDEIYDIICDYDIMVANHIYENENGGN